MGSHNLAIVFGPTLVRGRPDDMQALVRDTVDQCQVVDSLIRHVRGVVFA